LKKAKMSAVTEEREYNDEIAISNFEQKEYIASLNNNARQFKNEFTLIENYQKTNNKFRVEIHKKFTLAIACILFTLVGAPLGMLVRNGGMTIASGLSIAFFLIYYILLIWGEQLADRNLINPGLGSWLPNIVLFISGMIILKQSNKRN
jgi:lipopolysaccharide export system permease protein